jgi:hypothetical protein
MGESKTDAYIFPTSILASDWYLVG